MQPIVQFDKVSFSYNGYDVVSDVNLAVRKNEFVSIVGPNGGGKTTLLRIILGFLTPQKGVVTVFGSKPELGRGRIGYMPQHAHLDPQFPVTVQDVVLMGRLSKKSWFGPYRKADYSAVQDSLLRLKMWDFRNAQFSELSGGQRQRVLIARAIAASPELLLLDEPTAGLDLVVESEFYDLLQSLSSDLTVIMVSHDLAFVSKLVDKVICVKKMVKVHKTSEITGQLINEIYGAQMKIVRHDLGHSEELSDCLNS